MRLGGYGRVSEGICAETPRSSEARSDHLPLWPGDRVDILELDEHRIRLQGHSAAAAIVELNRAGELPAEAALGLFGCEIGDLLPALSRRGPRLCVPPV